MWQPLKLRRRILQCLFLALPALVLCGTHRSVAERSWLYAVSTHHAVLLNLFIWRGPGTFHVK